MSILRDLARNIYHLPDRVLHPLRGRIVERALGRGDPPRNVLFVCLGNICRSPYAEKSFVRASSDWSRPPAVASAGFIGPDRRAPEPARQVAADRGLDLSNHRSQILTAELLADADLVFVMDPAQARAIRPKTGTQAVHLLGDLDPVWAGRRAIRDPVEQPKEVFEEVYGRIDRCIEALTPLFRAGGCERNERRNRD